MDMRGRRRYAASLALVTLLAATAVAIIGASSATSKSTAIHGRMLNIQNFGGPGCGSTTGVCSSFTATGSIKGEGKVSIDTFPTDTFPGNEVANGIAISRAHTVITTKKGNLTCNEEALFDLPGADHAFVDLCLITGGTGIYAGATGYIQEVGTFDFATNLGQVEYFGKLVLAAS
jgi:hypothetical protein